MIKKVAFIGHPVRDMEAAKQFYGERLGLKLSNDFEGRWVEFDTPDGKSIALDSFSPEMNPNPAVYLALETDDIEAEMARLKEEGVKIHKDVWDNQVCKMALIEDPEGNVLMLHQIAPDRLAEGAGEAAPA